MSTAEDGGVTGHGPVIPPVDSWGDCHVVPEPPAFGGAVNYVTVLCPFCGSNHNQLQCPRVKAVEFAEDGMTVRRVEFHDNTKHYVYNPVMQSYTYSSCMTESVGG